MEQDYTVNNLIQLIYGECDIFERLELEDAIDNSPKLKREYQDMYKAYVSLPKVSFRPSKKSINKIIDFASNQLSATA